MRTHNIAELWLYFTALLVRVRMRHAEGFVHVACAGAINVHRRHKCAKHID